MGVGLLGVAWPAAGRARSGSSSSYRPGFAHACDDLKACWWDPVGKHIVNTRSGLPRPDVRFPSVWEMCIYHNVLYWDAKLRPAGPARSMIASQYAYVRSLWSDAQLATVDLRAFADPAAVMVHSSDDANWLGQYFRQVHEVTGDRTALQFLAAIIPTMRARFADPDDAGLGMLYATADGDREHQNLTSIFDAMIAYAACYVHAQSGDRPSLAYARRTFAWTRQMLRHPLGVYFVEADLRRTVAGRPNPGFGKAIGFDRPGDLGRGGSVAYLAGSMAMAMLGAELFRQTGEPSYRAEVRSIASAIVWSPAFARRGALEDTRDGWTDGYWAPAYVESVLPLVDHVTAAQTRRLVAATADMILAQRRPMTTCAGAGYGADWMGREYDPAKRFATWLDQARATAGAASSGAAMALPEQMMTSAQSVAVIAAAAVP